MADLQLSYSFMTVPGVLQAGADARLTIVVSNAGAPVTVAGIDFTLQDGPGARDIVNGMTPTTLNMPDGWSHPSPSGGKFSMTPDKPVVITRQGLLFTFDDIVNLSPRARVTLFDQVPTERVILALKGTDPIFRDLVLSSLASRAKRMVEAELQNGQPSPQRDVLKARRAIADLVLEMAEKGQIELNSSEGGDDYIQ